MKIKTESIPIFTQAAGQLRLIMDTEKLAGDQKSDTKYVRVTFRPIDGVVPDDNYLYIQVTEKVRSIREEEAKLQNQVK